MGYGVKTFWGITDEGTVKTAENSVISLDNAKEQVRLLLSTAVGEIPNSDFGHRLRELIPNSLDNRDMESMAKIMLGEAFVKWIPWALIYSIQVSKDGEGSQHLRLGYRIQGMDLILVEEVIL